MARKNQLVQFNTFVGGLVTEASPLTFPDNASIDEVNFELLRNGSRKRRLGFDLEDGYTVINANTLSSVSSSVPINWHLWKNAGGLNGKEILVFQTGRTIHFFDTAVKPLSAGRIYTYTMTVANSYKELAFADNDGYLVCVGRSDYSSIDLFNVDSNNTVTRSDYRLLIRDVFGIDAYTGTTELGSEPALRPSGSTNNRHTYNLRNQGWGIPRLRSDNATIQDPVSFFKLVSGNKYPSNADTVIQSLYPNPDISADRISRRFMPRDLLTNPIGGNTHSPRGYFVIDALNRGSSRSSKYIGLHGSSRYPQLDYEYVDFNSDRTPGGTSCVASFGGRVFYSGFSGEVLDGDSRSPNMSSYVLFSKLIQSKKDFGICYQEGDPTSDEYPELIDTDGGFLKLNDAYGIVRMINIGKQLLVFASNGVWAISGGSDYGFSATNYLVTKVSENGCTSKRSIVLVDGTVMYWSQDGIYHIKPNQMGELEAVNITSQTIQTLYNEISSDAKLHAAGVYDSYEKKVKWLYNNDADSTEVVEELVLDVPLGAFYKLAISNAIGFKRRVCIPFEVPPYSLSTVQEDIYYESDEVLYLTDEVYTDSLTRISGLREVMYLALIDNDGSNLLRFSFGTYSNTSFYDWEQTGNPVDAEAYLYTGYISGGEFMLNKQVPYINFYFDRTETGFDTIGGDLVPRNQSSCKVRALWDWSDNINSGRWGQEFQAYRYTRHYIPETSGSPYNYGQSIIVTKNKLRGKGRVLSLYMRSEPGKDCRLLGWSMMVSADGTV